MSKFDDKQQIIYHNDVLNYGPVPMIRTMWELSIQFSTLV